MEQVPNELAVKQAETAQRLSSSFAKGSVDAACAAAVAGIFPAAVACSLSVLAPGCLLIASSNMLAADFITLSLPPMTQSAAGLAILAKAYTRSAAQQSNMAEPAARCAACFILVSMPIWSESNLQHAGAHAAKPMGAITLELTAEAADDKFRESLAAVASLLGKTLPADSERVIHNITAFFVLPPGMPCMCGGRCALRPAPPLAEAEDSKDEDEDEEDDTGGGAPGPSQDGCKPDLQGGDRPDGSGGAYVAAGRDCIGSAFDIHRSSLEARGAQLIQRPPRRAALAARSQLEEIASGELPEHVAAASSPAMPSPPSPPVPDLATPFEAHKHTASPLVSSLLRTSRSGSGGSISEVAPRRPGHQASPAKPALSSAEDSSSLRHRSSSSASSASYATSKSSGELRLGAIAQHPLWLCFTNPSLERKFALWSARKQCKVDVVVVVLAVAVYTCLVFTQPLLVKRAPATYSALMVFLLPLLCMAASIQWYCHVRDWVVTCMSFISFVIVQFVVYSSYLDSFDRQTLTTLVFLGRWVGLQALFISPLSNWVRFCFALPRQLLFGGIAIGRLPCVCSICYPTSLLCMPCMLASSVAVGLLAPLGLMYYLERKERRVFVAHLQARPGVGSRVPG